MTGAASEVTTLRRDTNANIIIIIIIIRISGLDDNKLFAEEFAKCFAKVYNSSVNYKTGYDCERCGNN